VKRRPAVMLCVSMGAALAAAGHAQAAGGSRYFQVVDTDRDGRVSLAEYLERFTWAFRKMDADGNGVLEPGEQLAPNAPRTTLGELRARLQKQFERQDRDHDGSLDEAEFLAPPA
jgi:Ca2+-binding EF-hand superfamily protein